jgi:chemotaxis protein MotB
MRRLPSVESRRRVTHDRWLVSYADFMTLLFAFFATMYAISLVDARKLSDLTGALQEAFDDSVKAREVQASETRALEARIAAATQPSMQDVELQINEALAAELASQQVHLIVERRGVTLSIPEAGAFAEGRDELSAAADALVSRVAETLSRFPNAVRVEGHTDDVPIHTVRFVSNWDLSAARASRVVEFLIGRGVAPDRLSATGFAEFHPRVPNTSDEARASNRRIDLVILNTATSRAEEPAAVPLP